MTGRWSSHGLLVAALVVVLAGAPRPARAGALDRPPPEGERAAVQAARSLLDEGRPGEAEAALAATTSLAARRLRARALAFQGRASAAAALLETVERDAGETVDPRGPDGWIRLASRWKASPEALRRHARGFWLSQRDRCREARPELEEALRLAPGLADARYHLGYCLSALGDEAGAEREYRAAIAGYGPAEGVLRGSAQYGLGALLERRGGDAVKEAVALLRAAAAPDAQGRRPVILLALARAQRAAGDVRATQAVLAELLERLDAGEAPELTGAVEEEIRSDLALVGCRPRRAGAGEGEPPRCASRAAAELVRDGFARLQGDPAAAEKAFLEATVMEPGYGAAWVGLGSARLGGGRPAEAVEAYQKGLLAGGLAGRGWRADVERLLALALVQAGQRGPEAARLAEGAAWTAGADPGKRAWFDLLVGRAFLLSGNPGCAAGRFERVAGDATAPESARARATELLAPLRPDGTRPPGERCFEFQLHRPATLAAELAPDRPEHPGESIAAGEATGDVHPPDRLQTLVRFTGRLRELSPGRAEGVNGLLRASDPSRRAPDQPGGRVRREMEVEEGGATFWVPLQEVLAAPLQEELPRGGRLTLYLVRLRALDSRPVLVATEFQANGPPSR